MTPTRPARTATVLLLSASLLAGGSPVWATCGGGGGGGVGGARMGGDSARTETEAYRVPWTVVGPTQVLPGGVLGVYWFPSSAAEAKGSDLLTSRTLAVLSARCVALAIVTPDNAAARTKYGLADGAAGAVIVDGNAAELARVPADDKGVRAGPVEKLLQGEVGKREDAASSTLDSASEKIKANDVDGATAMLNEVWAQHCLLPDVAKKAAKQLKKLGHPVDVGDASIGASEPDLSPGVTREIVKTMNAGLAAERAGQIMEARRLYANAGKIDPADPTPVRFLAELYRHEIGDWDEARRLFDQVLTMRADPVSRAVALHGLGKMTIHEGRYGEGLALFQKSLDAYPLPLTYRNLAVYWNSERDHAKAHAYVKKALELDPDEEYNLIFAATYDVELGRPDEAREVAKRHEALLAASYNLAVIHAQLGDKDKALELLRRHFNVYEKFDAVRAKEMQEARDDVAFDALKASPDFIAMTAKADRDAAPHR